MLKKNGWFVAAGVLAILETVTYVLAAIIMFICSVVFKTHEFPVYGPDGTLQEMVTLPELVPVFIFLGILMLAFVALTIFQSVVYLKNSNKTYAELHQSSGLIITAIVFSFIAGGFLCGILGVLGYSLKSENTIETNESSNSYSSQSSESLSKKLEQLKNLKDSGIISDDEYQQKKEEILKEF